MSKLWLKDNKLLIKDNKLLLADECCCEPPFPCSFSKTVQGEVSTAMADLTGDIYDTCAYWWTDPETGETYCEWYDYTRSNLPGYGRWCNYGDAQYPSNQFFGFNSPPSGGISKQGRISCTISGNVAVENPSLNTYYFYLQLSASASVVGATNTSENTWGASGTLSISTPAIRQPSKAAIRIPRCTPRPAATITAWCGSMAICAAWPGTAGLCRPATRATSATTPARRGMTNLRP